ncbi:hypothetical protein QR46_1538 [Giardia duodenalis assemblage B]|uniref:Uncharacterized protein n=3 Tax=Giardia intestinalis TaxID=5741 RepID=A0A132NWP8_GIAIN|nr:Hypothetical protein GL50581_4138 [Giardia intestinalis ATCC 50581]ESU44012.1 Hypothetical protein GSB_14696 [Giardia intestinalis]KWX14493.1 hypothetical protein QR46_1538 [Giardia intestinalis assemblage B]
MSALVTLFEGDLHFALTPDLDTSESCVYAVQIGDPRLISIIRPRTTNLRSVIDPRSIELTENPLVLEFLTNKEREPYTVRGKQAALTGDMIQTAAFGVETTKQHTLSFILTDCATNIRFNVVSRPESTLRGLCLNVPNNFLDNLRTQREQEAGLLRTLPINAIWLVRLLKASCESDGRRDKPDEDVLTSDRVAISQKLFASLQSTRNAAPAIKNWTQSDSADDEESKSSSTEKKEESMLSIDESKEASDDDVDDTENRKEQRQQRQREKKRGALQGNDDRSNDSDLQDGDGMSASSRQTTRPTYEGYPSRQRV